jgi:hypothetical protein
MLSKSVLRMIDDQHSGVSIGEVAFNRISIFSWVEMKLQLCPLSLVDLFLGDYFITKRCQVHYAPYANAPYVVQ